MKLSSSLRAFVYGMTVYRLVDEGLCKTLCLEDLTHGTDPISNLKIRCVGGRPLPSDGQPNYYRNTVGYFYLYKDSEYGYVNGKPQLLDMGDGRVLPLVMGGGGRNYC